MLTPNERDSLMLNALEDIALAALRRETLSTDAQLINIILKMEGLAQQALNQLKRGHLKKELSSATKGGAYTPGMTAVLKSEGAL